MNVAGSYTDLTFTLASPWALAAYGSYGVFVGYASTPLKVLRYSGGTPSMASGWVDKGQAYRSKRCSDCRALPDWCHVGTLASRGLFTCPGELPCWNAPPGGRTAALTLVPHCQRINW